MKLIDFLLILWLAVNAIVTVRFMHAVANDAFARYGADLVVEQNMFLSTCLIGLGAVIRLMYNPNMPMNPLFWELLFLVAGLLDIHSLIIVHVLVG